MSKRKFLNRRWKASNNELAITQDGYTGDEMNVFIGTYEYAANTMIKKSAFLEIADKLQSGENFKCDDSDYAGMGQYFKGEKTKNGYLFSIKNILTSSVELPFSKVNKIIHFLKVNSSPV